MTLPIGSFAKSALRDYDCANARSLGDRGKK
jgi:hypothetical protein